MKKIALFIFSLLLFSACSQAPFADILSKREIRSFCLSHESNNWLTVAADLQRLDDPFQGTIILPHDTPLQNFRELVASFTIEGYALHVDERRQISGETMNDFTLSADNTLVYRLYSFDGKSDDYQITVLPASAYIEGVRFLASENAPLASMSAGDIDCQKGAGGNAFWFVTPQALPLSSLVPHIEIGGSAKRRMTLVTVDTKGKETETEQWNARSGGSASAVDYSSPQRYRVYDTRGYSIDYQIGTCRLNRLRFKGDDNGFAGEHNYSVQNMSTESLSIELPAGTDRSALVADFDFSGDWLSVNGTRVTSGKTQCNFGSQAEIIVGTDTTATQKRYTLAITLSENPVPDDDEGGGQPQLPRYTLSYNANGASGGVPATKSYTAGTSVTIAGGSALAKAGYSFAGWNTKADGSGNTYPANVSITMPAQNLTLFAQWTRRTCTVSFNSQGGGGVASQNVFYGDCATVPAAPTLTDATFQGWFSDVDCTTAWNFATDAVIADMTLYAKWHKLVTGISFEMDGTATNYETYRGFNSKTLTAVVVPADAYDKTLTWSSDNSAVTISGSDNLVRTLSFPGADTLQTATITVTNAASGVSETFTVTVHSYKEVSGSSGLDEIRYNLGGHYKLTGEINLSTVTNWLPIGRSGYADSSVLRVFSGVFDGNNKTISNMTSIGTGHYWGLFARNNGHIKKVRLMNVSITSTDGSIGALVGCNDENGVIEYCSAYGTVTGGADCGGLVGVNDKGTIRYSYSNCSVIITIDNASFSGGGFLGYSWSGTIENCYSGGSVTCATSYSTMIGGFAGSLWSNTSISKCYSSAAVSNSSNMGGFSGKVISGLTDCFYDSTTSGYVAGTWVEAAVPKNLIEMNEQSTFTDAAWDFSTVWTIGPSENGGYPYLQQVAL